MPEDTEKPVAQTPERAPGGKYKINSLADLKAVFPNPESVEVSEEMQQHADSLLSVSNATGYAISLGGLTIRGSDDRVKTAKLMTLHQAQQAPIDLIDRVEWSLANDARVDVRLGDSEPEVIEGMKQMSSQSPEKLLYAHLNHGVIFAQAGETFFVEMDAI